MEFKDFGHTTTILICNWIFETFLVDGKFKRLSNKPLHARLWHVLHKLWHFIFFLSNEGMLLAATMAAKSTQNCPILPKSTQRQLAWGTLNTTKNWDFNFFSKKKTFVCRRGSKACAHSLDFQYNIFYFPFVLSKNCLCMWISAYFLVENNFFLNIPHLLWIWDFVNMYLTHLETRIQRCTFHI
jgi:hypothetical protein